MDTYGLISNEKKLYQIMADQTQSESHSGAVNKINKQSDSPTISPTISPTTARHSSDQFARDALLQPEVTKAETDAEEPIHKGIYWWSPIAMVTFFLLGVLTPFMHHFYYTILNGRQVGNDLQQQWALRFESPSYLAHFID